MIRPPGNQKIHDPKIKIKTMLCPDLRNERLIVKNTRLFKLAMAIATYRLMLDINKDGEKNWKTKANAEINPNLDWLHPD